LISILSHFNSYFLIGFKRYNFLIWQDIYNLVKEKAHLTNQGLAKIKTLQNQLNKWD
jgi:hypothetical protein